MVNIRVLRDFVAVKKLEKEETGLIKIVRLDERLLTGEVVSVGTGVLTSNGSSHKIEVEVGDKIAFDKMNAVEIEHKGEKYLIVNELSIRCVLL